MANTAASDAPDPTGAARYRPVMTAPAVVHPSGVIPQGLVDKVVARRGGRLHMHPTLDGPRTAFVVVDLDEDSCRRAAEDASLYGPVNAVASAVRAAGGTVAFVTTPITSVDALARSLGPELAASYHDATTSGATTRLAADLDVHPEDLHAHKVRASAFFPGNCDLPDQLRGRGVTHVLIGGLATNICCESSARDACELGYRVTMVSDALLGNEWGLHEASLATFFRIFGDVRPSAEVIALLA
jgi:ureidoacrylate peracid hydrolase